MMDMIAGLDGEDPLGQRDRGSDDAELVRSHGKLYEAQQRVAARNAELAASGNPNDPAIHSL
jgi:hypothetical protein